jgi:GGDEF domain-containing protein
VRVRYEILFEAEPTHRDAVIQQAALRLHGQTRPGDLCARWGGNELLVLFDGPTDIARKRSEEIAGVMSGAYVIQAKTIAVRVQAQCLDVLQALTAKPASSAGPL